MSYTPTTWATGDTVTAEKLNNIETGIQEAAASGGLPAVGENDKNKYLHTNSSTGDAEWVASEIPTVGSSNKGKYLHTNSSTGALEWDDVSEVPSVGSSDKNKFLHTNSSTGALEWLQRGSLTIVASILFQVKRVTTSSQVISEALSQGRIVLFTVPSNDTSQLKSYTVSITGNLGGGYFYGSLVRLIDGVPTLFAVELTGADTAGNPGTYTITEVALPTAEDFIITCTPTSADMSGTMDKTPEEITAAYLAGKNIKMREMTDVTSYSEVYPSVIDVKTDEGGEITMVYVYSMFYYHSNGQSYLVHAATSGTESTYSTAFYTLTPAT